MTRRGLVRTSRFIALVLRHKPHAAGIELDEHGWADVRERAKDSALVLRTERCHSAHGLESSGSESSSRKFWA